MRQVPAVLAFALLCLQAALPWTARHFVTQDGPSHLYGSVVVRELLTNPRSPYHAVYTLQHRPIPNWASTVILAVLVSIAGAAHAEQVLATLLIVLSFIAFSYASRSLDPDAASWSPLANALIVTFFLTRGYYNFELGMALGLFVLGYGIRNLHSLTVRRAAVLAAGWVAVYFTHLFAAGLLILAFIIVSLWVYVPALTSRHEWRVNLRRLSLLGASLTPAMLLILIHAATIQGGGPPAGAMEALRTFPMYLFFVSSGTAGRQEYLFPGLVCAFVWGIASMRTKEWTSARGGLLLASVAVFLLYLFLPDFGPAGGGEIKVRAAWAVLLLAGVAASSVRIHTAVRAGFAIYFAVMVVACSVAIASTNARMSRLVDDYASLLDGVPAGSTVIRLRYPTPSLLPQFQVPNDLLFLPLVHVDSLVAAENGNIELANYQAAARIFPYVFQPRFSLAQQWFLWEMEDANNEGAERLKRLRITLPLTSAYYVLLGEDPENRWPPSDLSKAIADLESSGARLRKSVGNPLFARLYR